MRGLPNPPDLPSALEGTCSQFLLLLFFWSKGTDLTCPEDYVLPLQPKPSSSPTRGTWQSELTEPLAFTESFGKHSMWLRWQELPFITPSPTGRDALARPQGLHKGLQSHSSTPEDRPRGPPAPVPSAEPVQGKESSCPQPGPLSLFLAVSISLL